ncbi:MAG: hypothetical protein HY862_04380 [Chloroflexi bacterium]|nr:hypothetical protein [Chloroflexota bacterium]
MTAAIVLLLVLSLVFVACRSNKKDNQEGSRPTVRFLPTVTPINTPLPGVVSPTPLVVAGNPPVPTAFGGFPSSNGGVAPTLPSRWPENMQIVSPVVGTAIRGNVSVFGSASHPDFVQYALEFGPDPNTGGLYYPITPQAITQPVINNVLGVWNTASIPDGLYQIRLHVYLTGGRQITNVLVGGLRVSNNTTGPGAGGGPSQGSGKGANQNPVISPVAPLNLRSGLSTTVALGVYDPDYDTFTINASTDNPTVLTVAPVGQAITLNALGPGIATITVRVVDAFGGTAETSFLVTVANAPSTNSPPNITGIPNQTMVQNTNVIIPLSITDPNGDVYNFSVSSSVPGVVAATPGVGNNINLAALAPGTTNITVVATDSKQASNSIIFSVVVNPAVTTNNPPSIGAVTAQTLNVNEVRDIALSISDPDNDPTSFTAASSNPAWVTTQAINATTLRITSIAAGTVNITVTVTDNRGASVTTMFTATVNAPPPPNQAPVIGVINDQTIEVGETRPVDLSLSDPDGDPITFSVLSENPAIASVAALGTSSISITGVTVGNSKITVAIGDGRGGSSSASFTVTVNPATIPNQLPVLDSIAPQAVTTGQTIPVNLVYSDPDNDPITIEAVTDNAAIATVFQSGPSELTIAGVSVGTANITATVNDGRGGTAARSFAVTVTAANQYPQMTTVDPQTCQVGQTLNLVLTYADPDGDVLTLTAVSSDNAIAQASITNNPLNINCVGAGVATITVTADDGRGGVTPISFPVSVDTPNQNPAITQVDPKTCAVGESLIVPLTVSDPDGDPISINPTTSDPNIANVALNLDGTLNVVCLNAGTITITVFVGDTRGGQSNMAFGVTVNTLPTDTPSATPTETATTEFTATPSATSTETETPSATPTETATTEFTATPSDTPTETETPSPTPTETETTRPNEPPYIMPIDPQACLIGSSLDVALNYGDSDNEITAVSALSSDDSIASAALVGSTLTVICNSVGVATVTLSVTSDITVEATFDVTVNETPNQLPSIDTIGIQTCEAGQILVVNYNATDPDSDVLTATTVSSDPTIATATVLDSFELSLECLAAGSTSITVTVNDGRGGEASSGFTVDVTAANQPPSISSIDPQACEVGQTLTIPMVVADPDNDPVTITALSDNEAAAQVAVVDNATLSLTCLSNGFATITVGVDDGRGGTNATAFTVNVAMPNQSPTIAPIDPQTCESNQPIVVNYTATDPENDLLTTIASSSDTGIAIASVTDAFSIAVQCLSPGTATITVSTDDGRGGTASTDFAVTVATPNQMPTIENILSQTCEVGQTLTVAYFALDPDGTPLTTNVSSDNPAISASLADANNLAILCEAAGTATITVAVDDGLGGTATTSFNVEATAPNQPPTIDPIAPQNCEVGQPLTVSIVVADADNDPITVTALSDNDATASVTVLDNTTLSVNCAGDGFATITVGVDDGRGGTNATAFAVNVTTPNQSPAIAPIDPQTCEAGQPIIVNYTATDPENDLLTTTATSSDAGVATANVTDAFSIAVQCLSSGTTTISVNTDDGRGGTASTDFTITVSAANQPPSIDAIAPQNCEVGQPLTVTINPTDPDGNPLTITALSDNDAIASATVLDNATLSVNCASDGFATITVGVDDGQDGTNATAFSVNVTAANQPPSIDPLTPVTCEVGQPLVLPYVATDPDADLLTVTAFSDNDGIAQASVLDAANLSVTCNSAGNATITISADDGRGGANSATLSVTVSAANQLPNVNAIAPQNCEVGQPLTVALNPTDPDGDLLTVTAFSDNDGIAIATVFDNTTLNVNCVSNGFATITVGVDDGRGGTNATAFSVNVATPNQPPSINPIDPQSCAPGDTLNISFTAFDPDGDPLNIFPQTDVEGIVQITVLDSATLSVTCLNAGLVNVTLNADDGRGGTNATFFSINVLVINNPPTLDAIAPQTCAPGDTLTVAVPTFDPDGDFITTQGFADNAGIAQVAVLDSTTLSVACLSSGTATISVGVDDGRGGTNATVFTVDVVAANQAPTIAPIDPQGCEVGQTLPVLISASDPDGDVMTVTAFSNNDGVAQAFAPDASTINITCNSAGTANITVNLDDGRGGTAQGFFDVTVTDQAIIASVPTFDINNYPILPDISTNSPLYEPLLTVYQNGVFNLGRRNTVFSVVGDESLGGTDFLDDLAYNNYNLGSYPDLQNIVNHYSVQPAHDGLGDGATSFNVTSAATGEGWTIENVLDPAYADPNICTPGETPFDCELRLSQPSVVFISFTPSDATATDIDTFRFNLQQMVDSALASGVIPILTTLPDDGSVGFDTLNQYNEVIATIATDSDVPLWNLYLTMQQAPNGVYAVGGFGPMDLSDEALAYGVNRRNVHALFILDSLLQTFFQ